MAKIKSRCAWVNLDKPHDVHYHDTEWGVPSHDDRHLFELLILEGAQAGLSWETVLKKREGYRRAFHNFDPVAVARMTDAALSALVSNPDIIRHRRKIFSVRDNAKVFLDIQKTFGSFDRYVWSFVDHQTIMNARKRIQDIPTSTPESRALSKDLKRRGMTFVGETIMYAYMQAVGMVHDHTTDCWRFKKK